MDFVVVGLGLGTLGVLCGVLMIGVLAPRRDRAAARTGSTEAAARDLAVAAEQREIGRAAVAAGTAVIVATSLALAAGLDDRTSAFLVTSIFTLAAIGLLYWMNLYRHRHPLPARPRRTPSVDSTAPLATGFSGNPGSMRGNGRLPDLALLDTGADSAASADDRNGDGAASIEREVDAGVAAAWDESATAAPDTGAVVAPAPTPSSPDELAEFRANRSYEGEDDPGAVVAVGPGAAPVAAADASGAGTESEEDDPVGR